MHPAKGREDSMRKRDNIVDNIDQSNLSFNVHYQVYRGSVETGPLGGTEVEKNRKRQRGRDGDACSRTDRDMKAERGIFLMLAHSLTHSLTYSLAHLLRW